jgi:hypothetical protein
MSYALVSVSEVVESAFIPPKSIRTTRSDLCPLTQVLIRYPPVF